MASRTTGTPTELRPRADATSSESYSTDSNGNLICPTDPATCPVCPDDQECYQQARTSTSCAKYICVPKTNLSKGSVPVGGIVGGVLGGVVVILALLFAYYKFVYRKKHPRLTDDLAMSEMDADGSFLVAGGDDSHLGEKSDRPQARRAGLSNSVNKNHRLLAYESFMRPQTRYTKRPGGSSPGGSGPGSVAGSGGRGQVRGGMANYANLELSKRNSIATTISTTNASNILPIAYIPGVTIRPTKNNTRSIYSYETDLIFSDMNAIENASIVADRTGAHQKSTMTAIRAQPKLINVARIDEDDEDMGDEDLEDEEIDLEDMNLDDLRDLNREPHEEANNNTWDIKDLSVGTVLYTVNTLSSNMHEQPDSEADSDVDSDIVEIGRATSTRQAREVLVDHTDLINLERDDQLGSFILDIGVPERS